LELLNLGCPDPYPWQASPRTGTETPPHATDARVTVDERIAEWDYGDYEGVTSPDIKKMRERQALPPWDIWRDGCPGGESPDDIIRRVDSLIADIRDRYHAPVIGKPKNPAVSGDVMVVGHGHILRAFAIRWVGKPLTETALIMEAGGVGTLSYEHHSIHEPAILLGGGFVVGED
jgi:probable phosphoglycerate mutase